MEPRFGDGGAEARTGDVETEIIGASIARRAVIAARATKAGAIFVSISENIVRSASAQDAHGQFMKSPAHRANVLDRDMDSVGVGVAKRGGELFVVEDFAKAK